MTRRAHNFVVSTALTTRRHGRGATALALTLSLLPAACRKPDPRVEVALSDVETYWAVDRPVGGTQYLAPVVRFRLQNTSGHPLRAVDANATFRRKGETVTWSGAYQQAAPLPDAADPARKKPLEPGQAVLVVLKPEGEGRYTSTIEPEQMLAHPQFRDVWAEVFVRVGSSPWTKMTQADVERRLGPRSATAQRATP
jgi:hypothetical protein